MTNWIKCIKGFLVIVAALMIVACSTSEEKVDAGASAAKAEMKSVAKDKVMEKAELSHLYEVHKDNRIYIFYDRDLYKSFKKSGHTPYMFSRIGEGPNGETMVFALTGEDKKKRSGIPSVDIVDGNVAPSAFYGETYNDGRLYVFTSYDIMADYRKSKEATYRYTDIGAGPNGETVVYVLSKADSKEKPEAVIALFKSM